MNVAIVVSKLSLSGGMERYSFDLIKGFNELGITPYVVTSKVDENLLSVISFKVIKISKPKFLGKLGIHFFNLQLKFIKIKYNIDLMIACNRNSHSDVAICGGTHIGYLNAIKKKPGFWDRREIGLEKKLYVNSKFIVAHSKLMAWELQRFYGIDEEKIKIIYPPINSSIFYPLTDELREEYRLKNNWFKDDIILLFPSSGHERKGLGHIIASIKKSKYKSQIKLIVLGKYNPKFYEEFVYFQGFKNDIQLFYQTADFTILASIYEPFGLVGPESVLCGTPCLFSDNIGATEVLSFHSCHIFSHVEHKVSLDTLFEDIIGLKKRLVNSDTHIEYDISLLNHTQKILSYFTGINNN